MDVSLLVHVFNLPLQIFDRIIFKALNLTYFAKSFRIMRYLDHFEAKTGHLDVMIIVWPKKADSRLNDSHYFEFELKSVKFVIHGRIMVYSTTSLGKSSVVLQKTTAKNSL